MLVAIADFIKYIGFTIIMILIGITGYLIKKNPRIYRKLHFIFTILFFERKAILPLCNGLL